MLIEHGADVNAVKNGGSTPLHEAAFRENLDVAKVLIAAGAKNLSNKQNELPIDFLRGPEARDPRLRAELIDVLSRLPAPAQSNQSRSPGAQPESSLTVQSRTSEPAQSSVGNTEAQLTDTDPLRLVDRLLDRQSYETLLLGSVVVYGGSLGQPVQPPPGNNITVAQYSRYKQWANVGVINIQSQGSTSQRLQQSFSWNDWMSMTQGDQEKINVVPTQTAKEITQIAPNTLKIKMAAFKTENIVKNEERVMGLSKYDILMGTYTADWTATFRNFCQVNKACTLSDKGKFRVLLKFDEFTNQWNIVTWDAAESINAEFTTQNVDQQVRLLH